MTRKELKKRLYRYRDIERERRQLQDEILRVRALMTQPTGGQGDGMPRGSGGVSDPVYNVVAKHEELLNRYGAKVAELMQERETLENLIEGLEDPRLRVLMRYRYITGLNWEAVSEAIGYEWRQTHNLHAKALDEILAKIPE